MRGGRFLSAVCALLMASGAASCRLEVERLEPAPKLEPGRAERGARTAPLSRTPRESGLEESGQAGICEPGASPVMIVVVESPRKVESASALWKDTPILLQEPETVVFADGRIVTSRLEATGDHVQSLGWAHRDIEIVGGLPAASGAWQRRSG